MKDEAFAVQTRNLAVLTDAQKTKLKALNDALQLLPVVNEAQNAGILAPPGLPLGTSLSSGTGLLGNSFASFVLGVSSSSGQFSIGCQQPQLVAPFIRTGDFSGTP